MDLTQKSPKWTTVSRYDHPTDAHIAAGKLQSEGVPVFLHGINHASANWLLANALGGIQLQVPEDFVDEAKVLLTPMADKDESVGCPNCGSNSFSAMTNSRKIAFLAIHLFSIPLPWRDELRHCDSCGEEWPSRDD